MPDPFAQYAASSDPFAAYAVSEHPSEPKPGEIRPYQDPRGIVGQKVIDFAKGLMHRVSEHPVEAGAMAGATLAAPFTGGGSLAALGPLVPIVAAGAGGAGGAGIGMIAKAFRGDADTPKTAGDVVSEMGSQGAQQAALEGGGAVLGKGAELAGRGLYRAAVRPAAKLTEKYGDLVGAGLREGAPVGSSRAVQGEMQASKSSADALVENAEAAGRVVPTQAVTDKFTPLVDKAATREALGNGAGDFNEIAARERAFNAANPTQQIPPTRALELKREADTLANTAQNAVRRGGATNDMTGLLHDATRSGLKEGLEGIAPGLADQNARTSTLYGLSRALRAAENRPHQLENIVTTAAGIGSGVGALMGTGSGEKGAASGAATSALTRVALAPWMQSRLGITADRAGKLPYAALARLAMLAALSDQGPGNAEEQKK